MSIAPHVVVVTLDPQLQSLAAALEAEGISAETAGSFSDVSRSFGLHAQCACVIDSALPSELAMSLAKLVSHSEGTRMVVLADPDSFPKLAANPRSEGVDLCPKHESVEETALRLKAVLILAGYDLRISELPVAGSSLASPGEVIAVFSVKGGVGKSTIAVNLAAGLLQMHSARPLLIDANLYFGDVPVLLDIAPKRSIFDLCDLKEL